MTNQTIASHHMLLAKTVLQFGKFFLARQVEPSLIVRSKQPSFDSTVQDSIDMPALFFATAGKRYRSQLQQTAALCHSPPKALLTQQCLAKP